MAVMIAAVGALGYGESAELAGPQNDGRVEQGRVVSGRAPARRWVDRSWRRGRAGGTRFHCACPTVGPLRNNCTKRTPRSTRRRASKQRRPYPTSWGCRGRTVAGVLRAFAGQVEHLRHRRLHLGGQLELANASGQFRVIRKPPLVSSIREFRQVELVSVAGCPPNPGRRGRGNSPTGVYRGLGTASPGKPRAGSRTTN